jgi:hypothetical protein
LHLRRLGLAGWAKGGITLASYIAIAIGITGAAFGQTHQPLLMPPKAVKTVTITFPERGWAPVLPEAAEAVVIWYGAGGRVDAHNWKFAAYRNKKSKVEMRGGCYSACTLITAYVSKADLCIAEGAFFAFHAARSLDGKESMPASTALMYWQQPADIRSWIDRNGGHQNLPLDGFWTMYDRDLWAMGYPKCQ